MIRGRYRYADAYDMYALLGTKVLPPEGLPERDVQGVRVYVKPLTAGRQALRVTAICDCGRHLPVGRLHQHLPVVVRRFNSDEIIAWFHTTDEAEAFIARQLEDGGVYLIGGDR